MERRWTDGEDREWRFMLDRVNLQCGSCDASAWLHLHAPDGTRYTAEVDPPPPLEQMSEESLAEMARAMIES